MLDAGAMCLSEALLTCSLPVDALDCNTWLNGKRGYDNAPVEYDNASVGTCKHDNASIDEHDWDE